MHKAVLDKEQIVQMYKDKVSLEAIARCFHTSKPRIKEVLTKENVELVNVGKRRDVSVEELNRIAEEYNNGVNMEELSQKYHIRIKKLCRLFRENGVEISKWRGHVKKEKPQPKPRLRKHPIYEGPWKVCPYCGWKTKDVSGQAYSYAIHLQQKHHIDPEEHVSKYPEDKVYLEYLIKRKYEKVKCQICGKYQHLIDNRHLQKHGITKDEYIRRYGADSLISPNTKERLHECMVKMMDNPHWIRKASSYEESIKQLLDDHGIQYRQHDRKILEGMELDFLIGNVAIEFDGNYHHTEWYGKKDKTYHLTKTLMCLEKGIKLIHIFQDEYELHRDIVEDKILQLLHVNHSKKIGARKCSIIEISRQEAQIFVGANHLQGFATASVYLGAIYDGQLIGVMTFKKEANPLRWEMNRFCTLLHTSVQGLASKMLNYFKAHYEWEYIKSFLDRRWNPSIDDNLYAKIGFTLEKVEKPDYCYYNPRVDHFKRFHKFALRKKQLSKMYGFPLEMTETEMAKAAGFDRIWNCGLIKYSITKNP